MGVSVVWLVRRERAAGRVARRRAAAVVEEAEVAGVGRRDAEQAAREGGRVVPASAGSVVRGLVLPLADAADTARRRGHPNPAAGHQQRGRLRSICGSRRHVAGRGAQS